LISLHHLSSRFDPCHRRSFGNSFFNSCSFTGAPGLLQPRPATCCSSLPLFLLPSPGCLRPTRAILPRLLCLLPVYCARRRFRDVFVWPSCHGLATGRPSHRLYPATATASFQLYTSNSDGRFKNPVALLVYLVHLPTVNMDAFLAAFLSLYFLLYSSRYGPNPLTLRGQEHRRLASSSP
jgi:hypothetical protein